MLAGGSTIPHPTHLASITSQLLILFLTRLCSDETLSRPVLVMDLVCLGCCSCNGIHPSVGSPLNSDNDT